MIQAGDWQQVGTANEALVQLLPDTRSQCMGVFKRETNCVAFVHTTWRGHGGLWHSMASAHEVSARMHVEYVDHVLLVCAISL